ncbi:MAG: MOSC domain-containing protein [Betaproteobacteria bacterium]|nr:MOSC domain-containing protein [Betaproteobacteria bacterium]
MKVIAVSLGVVSSLPTPRGAVPSAIAKQPVAGRVKVSEQGFEGDQQADHAVHGGVNKAVCLVPSEHYPRWASFLNYDVLSPAFFGENLTTEGVSEHTLCIGDVVEIGSARLVVRSPRLPCYKFAARAGRSDAARFMLNEAMTGLYLSVEAPGDIGTGDPIRILSPHPDRVSIADYVNAMMQKASSELLTRLLRNSALPEDRKQLLVRRIEARYDGSV